MSDMKSYLAQVESGVKKDNSKLIEEQEYDVSRHNKLLSLMEQEINALEKDMKIVVEYPKKLDPDFEFQEIEDYWKVQNELRLINFERQKIDKEAQMNGLKKVIEAKQKELDRLKGEQE